MTEPIAMTIRHMKIEDYPLVYELWIRCTGFTMRDIDDCKDAIKTFLERNPNTCFVAEDDGGRIIGAILAGHDGRRSRIYHNDFWERQGFAVRDDLVYRELPL